MSVTQTYYLAHTARDKLSSEAARADHNLRLLVGHANLLDSLMLELAEAEQEQKSWFNESVKKANKTEEHTQLADALVEDPEEDWQAEDAESSDSDSDYDSDETPRWKPPLPKQNASHHTQSQRSRRRSTRSTTRMRNQTSDSLYISHHPTPTLHQR